MKAYIYWVCWSIWIWFSSGITLSLSDLFLWSVSTIGLLTCNLSLVLNSSLIFYSSLSPFFPPLPFFIFLFFFCLSLRCSGVGVILQSEDVVGLQSAASVVYLNRYFLLQYHFTAAHSSRLHDEHNHTTETMRKSIHENEQEEKNMRCRQPEYKGQCLAG